MCVILVSMVIQVMLVCFCFKLTKVIYTATHWLCYLDFSKCQRVRVGFFKSCVFFKEPTWVRYHHILGESEQHSSLIQQNLKKHCSKHIEFGS